MLIRPARPEDAPAIWAIMEPVIRAGDTYALDPQMSETEALAYWLAPEKETFVVEDSVHGIHGAKAAGMRVIGFTGASHSYPGHADALTEAGAETVIRRWADFPGVLAALAEWSDA